MSAVNNRRIAKNSLMLYFRMAIVMIVQLYTSRIVLAALGVDDFGLWSVVGTLVVMVSFITGPLSSSTQRFMNYELGRENYDRIRKIFNESLIINAIFSVVIVVLLESVGLWFLNNKMDIPGNKMLAANYVYQFAVVSFIINILRMPYDATIIANEKFDFYAVMGIVEVVMKLAIVWLLPLASEDSALICYAALMLGVTVVSALCYVVYCRKEYQSVRLKWYWDTKLIKELLSFSGWSTFGSFAVVMGHQGVSILFNLFFGLAVNAAIGITNQVANAINQFVSSFQTAFRPQLVKSYAAGESDEAFGLVCMTSKISCFLVSVIGIPLLLNIDYILSIWLTTVPPLAPLFCQLTIIIAVVEAAGSPLWMIVQADGRIKAYQIYISLFMLLTVIVSYVLFELGCMAYVALLVKLVVAFLCLGVRLIYVKKLARFSIRKILKDCMIPEFCVVLMSFAVPMGLLFLFHLTGLTRVALTSVAFVITFVPSIMLIGLNRAQRTSLTAFMRLRLKMLNKNSNE